METLILHPSSEAQWYSLVQEAKNEAHIPLTEELESYLVFLLMRFIGHPELAQSALALKFLESLSLLGQVRENALQEIGDNCLLVAGLFPGRAKKRRVRISYYVNLGQTAYCSLSHTRHKTLAPLFSKLCNHFVGLIDVLHALRSYKENYNLMDLTEAEEFWQDTHSAYALKLLKKQFKNVLFSEHFPTLPNIENKKH